MVVSEPPQVEVGLVVATVRPTGSVSVKAMLLKARFPGTEALVLSIVNERVEVAFLAIGPELNDLEKSGSGVVT